MLRFETRRRIALQFVSGLNHLHNHGFLHRDISLQNVLIKQYDHGAVIVKLSDFGLLKDNGSTFTMSDTEMRGTIRDPLWTSFKDFDVSNEIYAAGVVLAFIFTGREGLPQDTVGVNEVIHKCTILTASQRYASVLEVIKDLESFSDSTTSATV